MAILTFLFFSSVFYFVLAESVPAPVPQEDYQKNLNSLLDVVSSGVDQYMIPLWAGFDPDDQQYMKAIVVNGFAGLLNSATVLSGNLDAKQDDDILIRLDSLASSTFGIPYETPDKAPAQCEDLVVAQKEA